MFRVTYAKKFLPACSSFIVGKRVFSVRIGRPEYIGVLEAKAILAAVKHRTRARRDFGHRVFLFMRQHERCSGSHEG